MRLSEQRLDLHQFCQMMVATMCRVDELRNLRFQDCHVEPETKLLTARVTGKRDSRVIQGSESRWG